MFIFGLGKYTDFHPAPQNGTGLGFGCEFSLIIKLPLCVCVLLATGPWSMSRL